MCYAESATPRPLSVRCMAKRAKLRTTSERGGIGVQADDPTFYAGVWPVASHQGALRMRDVSPE